MPKPTPTVIDSDKALGRKLHPKCNVRCGDDFGDQPKYDDEIGHAEVEIGRGS